MQRRPGNVKGIADLDTDLFLQYAKHSLFFIGMHFSDKCGGK